MATVTCEGIWVEVGSAGVTAETALALAGAIAARSGAWIERVEPVRGAERQFLFRPRDWEVPLSDAWRTLDALERDRDVARAELSLVVPGVTNPDHEEPLEATVELIAAAVAPSHDWHLHATKTYDAWKLPLPAGGRRHGAGIVVAHPDTGYAPHDELRTSDPQGPIAATRGYDFEDGDTIPQDPLVGAPLDFPGHGSATASIIVADAGVTTRPKGVHGLAPAATLVPLRISESVIHLSFANLTEAIGWAIEDDCHVISMSLGGPFHSEQLHEAIKRATDAGIICIAASGNRWPYVVYPGRYDEVVAVAASGPNDVFWKPSGEGEQVDVTAPGAEVSIARANVSTTAIEMGSGTSYSAAVAAGACALWLAHHGRDQLVARYGLANLAPVFKEVLGNHGVRTPAGWDTDKRGRGILDVNGLLSAPLPATAPARWLSNAFARIRAPIERLLAYLPGADRKTVVRRLKHVLRTDDDGLARVLERHGKELSLHLATNPELAKVFRGEGDRPRTRVLRDEQFVKSSSPRLRKQLRRG